MNTQTASKTMQAMVLEQFGQPQVLKEIKKPIPATNQVLVKIKACGVNPLDIKIKNGQAAHAQIKLPAVLGIDLAGVVEVIGEGITTFKPGDEVYGMAGGVYDLQGSLAEYAAVDADLLALKPGNLSFREAAVIPLIFITAWEALVDKANIQAGKTVLVHGGAGGVGHMAVQLARAKGAIVFSTVDPDKNQLIQSYGATPIDYTRLSVEEYVKEYTNDKGFDIILDTIGGTVLDDSFKAVKRYSGHVVSILGWSTHSLAPLSFRNATYSGVFTLYPLLSGHNRVHHGWVLKQASELIQAGKLKPLVDPHRYTLITIEEAYKALENRIAEGKLAIELV